MILVQWIKFKNLERHLLAKVESFNTISIKRISSGIFIEYEISFFFFYFDNSLLKFEKDFNSVLIECLNTGCRLGRKLLKKGKSFQNI